MFTSQWVLSQNHRTIKVRKVLQDHWVQSLTKYHHVHKTIALSTMSSCFLNKHFQGWWLTFQTPYQLLCPSLDMLQHLDVFTVVSGPKLDTGFEMWPQQCVVKGDNYCPVLLATLLLIEARIPFALLPTWAHTGSCPVSCQIASTGLFHWAAFQQLFPTPENCMSLLWSKDGTQH